MIYKYMALVGLTLFLAVSHLYASDDTTAQTGEVSCFGGNLGTPLRCPDVSFPKPFSGEPQVTLSVGGFELYSADPHNLIVVNPLVDHVNETGFSFHVGQGGLFLKSIRVTWIAIGPPSITAVATPKYVVLTVMYAPPGTNGGNSQSFVSYGSGSQYGSTISASQTFNNTFSVEVTSGAGFLGNGGEAGLNYSFGRSTTDSQSMEVKNAATSALTQPGPPRDGISHDRDRICVLFNPSVDLSLTASSITWGLRGSQTPHILCLYVGNLNGHIPWEQSVKDTVDGEHLTAKDYASILQRDPLASLPTTTDPSTVDSSRYKLVTAIGYAPPLTKEDSGPVQSYNLTSSSISTVGSKAEDSYKVGLSVKAEANFFAKGSVKVNATWEWRNASSNSSSTGASESATANIGSPAPGYKGSNYVSVYYDTVYRTFAFAMIPTSLPLVAKGKLLNSAGSPLPRTDVTLTANGKTYHTFSNSNGEYKFFGKINGPFELGANGVAIQKLAIPKPTASIVLTVQ